MSKSIKVGVVVTPYLINNLLSMQAQQSLHSIRRQQGDFELYVCGFPTSEQRLDQVEPLVDYMAPVGENILAQTWNKGIHHCLFEQDCDFVIVSNLDVFIPSGTVQKLLDLAERSLYGVMWSPWADGVDHSQAVDYVNMKDHYAFFMLDEQLIDVVGWFDENFIPAYGEDTDMQIRIQRMGLSHVSSPQIPYTHIRASTARTTIKGYFDLMEEIRESQHGDYMLDKWGSRNARSLDIYEHPFNDKSINYYYKPEWLKEF